MSTAPLLQLVPRAPEQWISRQLFLSLSGWTRRWLAEQMRTGVVRTRETGHVQGRWAQLEFAISSLPAKARAAHEAEQLALQPSAPSLFGAATAGPRVALSDRQQAEASARRDLLAPLLEFRDPAHRSKYLRLRTPAGAPIRNLSDMVALVASSHGKSQPTVWRMLRAYDAAGEVGLAKKPRKDAGKSRWFEEHPQAAALVAYVGSGDGVFGEANAKACHRALIAQRERLNLALADVPSYDTIRRFLDARDADLKVLAKRGERRYSDVVRPHIERGYDDTFSNQVWIADTMKADVEVQNDVFDDLPLGQPIRLQLSAIVDYRSRFFVGTCWGVVESSIPIAASIRNAVLQHGPCEHFYVDNGKAYKKVAKGAVRGHMVQPGEDLTLYNDVREMDGRTGLLQRLGIAVTHCLPRHPQSKHIERQFGTVHKQYDSLWQTYTGGAPHVRPHTTERLMAIHRKSLTHSKPEWSMHPLASDYIAGFYAWLDWHHQQPMNARGMDGRSPAAVFAQDRNPRQRATPTAADLACTFDERATRVVDRCAVQMFGDRYVPGDDVALSRMLALSGDLDDRRSVTVLFDPLDHSYVGIADERGHLICTLQRQSLLAMAPHDPATRAQVAEGMRTQRAALRETKGKLAHIRKQGRLAGALAPLELLATNAAAPLDLGSVVTQAAEKPHSFRKAAQTAVPMHSHDVALAMAHLKETD